jgi:SpoVK/Ycf46/Vps4 family AAA+-type ATPase
MEWLKIFSENKQLLGESADLWCDIPDTFKRHTISKDKKIHAVFDFVRFEKAKLKSLVKDLATKFDLQEVFTATNRRTEFASFILGNENMCAIFSTNGDSGKQHVEYSFDLFSSNHEQNLQVRDFVRKLHTEAVASPEVYVLTNSGHGYSFSSIGQEDHVLEEDNYAEDVIKKYNHLVADLDTNEPCGKFSLLEGPPGTGKSYMIRGIIHKVSLDSNCMCVVIPPYLTSSLSDPGLIGAFIAQKSDNKDRRIVLILEDADDCVVPRGGDNMAKISSILNTTDGIIGNLLNIRIIASTNAIDQLDEALERNGRMCTRIHVGPPTKEKAVEIFKRITKNKLPVPRFEKGATLADIYKACNFPELNDGAVKKAVMGFKPEEE